MSTLSNPGYRSTRGAKETPRNCIDALKLFLTKHPYTRSRRVVMYTYSETHTGRDQRQLPNPPIPGLPNFKSLINPLTTP